MRIPDPASLLKFIQIRKMHVSVSQHSHALQQIFTASVKSVEPSQLIKSTLRYDSISGMLKIHDLSLTLNKNCYVIGFGKAVYQMAVELERLIGPHLREGIVSIPEGSLAGHEYHLKPDSSIQVFEGAKNNLPDENAYKTAIRIESLIKQSFRDAILFVLISGGGSALLTYPLPPLTLNEKCTVIKLLASAGANIAELNSVRTSLSKLKGGKLALLAHPTTVVSLILSDVVGDPLNVIASGPTVPQPFDENCDNPVNILKKYNLYDSVPENVKLVLRHGLKSCDVSSTQTPLQVYNFIIGNNTIALKAAESEAKRLDYVPIIISSQVAGQVSQIAKVYSKLVKWICMHVFSNSEVNFTKDLEQLFANYKSVRGIEDIIENIKTYADTIRINAHARKNILFIGGGEPTVVVKGNGIGGRNQELALEIAFQLHNKKIKYDFLNKFDIVFMSAGTDGIDGPTDAAGALSYIDLAKNAFDLKLNPEIFLRNNDSYSFFSNFRNGACHIKTGHTSTNVMDIHFLIVKYKLTEEFYV